MLGFLLEWLILSVAFWGTAQLVPGVRLDGWKASVFVSAVYATLHLLIGWLLFAVFAIGTLGVAYLLAFITWWVIGAIVLLLTDAFTRRFEVAGFGTALIASAVLALLGSVGHWVVGAMA